MALGSAFPPGFLKSQIQRQLVPGAVIKLRAVMDDGKLQEKRFVVAHVDEHTVCCVINTAIGPFLQARPALLKCQVTMAVAAHPFMSHDSSVDCSRTRSFATAEVIKELMGEPSWVLGQIAPDLRQEIIGALKFAPTLSPNEVARLCESLEP